MNQPIRRQATWHVHTVRLPHQRGASPARLGIVGGITLTHFVLKIFIGLLSDRVNLAGLDVRLLPDEDADVFVAEPQRIIADDRIEIDLPFRPEKSPVSPFEGSFFAVLEDVLQGRIQNLGEENKSATNPSTGSGQASRISTKRAG